ncbi:MAG: hypothetical protein WCK31_03300 [bacterium]
MQYFTSFLTKQTSLGSILWPEKSYLDDYSWDQIKKLYKWTSEDKHEYEVSLFNIDDDIIFSPIDRGNYQKVVSSHSAEVKYLPDNKTHTYLKHMYSDHELVRKKLIKIEELPKQIVVKYLFNFHTHPEYNQNDLMQLQMKTREIAQERFYSFFSGTDVNTLLSHGSYCIGLITDRVWILCKTVKSPDILTELQSTMLHEVTRNKLTNPDIPIIDLASKILSETNLKLYTARFNEPLELLN